MNKEVKIALILGILTLAAGVTYAAIKKNRYTMKKLDDFLRSFPKPQPSPAPKKRVKVIADDPIKISEKEFYEDYSYSPTNWMPNK